MICILRDSRRLLSKRKIEMKNVYYKIWCYNDFDKYNTVPTKNSFFFLGLHYNRRNNHKKHFTTRHRYIIIRRFERSFCKIFPSWIFDYRSFKERQKILYFLLIQRLPLINYGRNSDRKNENDWFYNFTKNIFIVSFNKLDIFHELQDNWCGLTKQNRNWRTFA